MNDITVIDRFLDVFSRYIDSGFGLLQGEVAFLTAALIVIDMTIAGLFWAMGHATGQGDDVIARLIRKVLYVGAFAYIIGNFNGLASIVFRSFAGLGLTASGSTLSMGSFLQPGRLAKVGIDAAAPILGQIRDLAGFPDVFINITVIVVLFLSWMVVVLCFLVLAVQLFVTLIEFKLTALAGFVLVPFALWGKTAFLAEKVLGNVIASGIKVLVLAVIVGIGSSLFGDFQIPPGAEPSIDQALVIMLASLAMLALGIFGPGIATGLVSGAPQLGAGAMAGAAIGAAGATVAVGAAAVGAGSAVAVGARMLPGVGRKPAPAAGGATLASQVSAAPAGGGLAGAGAGLGNVAGTGTTQTTAAQPAPAGAGTAASSGNAAGTGAPAAGQQAGPPAAAGADTAAAPAGVADAGAQGEGQKTADGPRSIRERVVAAAAAFRAGAPAPQAPTGDAAPAGTQEQPAWARRLQRRQQIAHAAMTAAHTLRGGDGGGSGQGPSLRDSDS
ncbi:MAG: P-type conjugative transfer protein TrbL [Acidovorax sp.]